jgi:hypothetical protein
MARGYLTQHLGNALTSGEHGLRNVPDYLEQVIESRAWEARTVVETGEEFAGFPCLQAYIEAGQPKGLGADPQVIARLIKGHPKVQRKYRKAMKRKTGPDNLRHNVTKTPGQPRGNSESYALQWLAENRPDLYEQVEAGKMSANAAMIAAGQRRRTLSVPIDDMERLATILRRNLDAEQLETLITLLGGA